MPLSHTFFFLLYYSTPFSAFTLASSKRVSLHLSSLFPLDAEAEDTGAGVEVFQEVSYGDDDLDDCFRHDERLFCFLVEWLACFSPWCLL